jgi:hypothetical protein
MTLTRTLRAPAAAIVRLDAARPAWRHLPWRMWGALAGIAVGGSLVYGASLALVLPAWCPRDSGVWLTLSAGLSWCVFGPLLASVSRRGPYSCAQACLVAMAWGEGVLLAGAAGNVLLRLGGGGRVDAARVNLALVACSNVVMAGVLARQLAALGVPPHRTLVVWFVGLDGSAVVLFPALRTRFGGAAPSFSWPRPTTSMARELCPDQRPGRLPLRRGGARAQRRWPRSGPGRRS